ncbi:MAG: gamma carbonic anhydrase family protein [Deltaproteobacteria bacterium]|nr:MAG: gamma carbonic anhydrase family protein [Deltaproteobacteria bacterium]
MPSYVFDDRAPRVGNESFVADSADVIGDVRIGDRCYVGFGAILRGDYGKIVVGDETAVEEGCLCHAKPGGCLTIGNRVTLGHGAIVHGKEIQDEAVIGMGAVIGFDVVVGRGAVVAEGAVVTAGTVIPPNTLVAGVPARVIKEIDAEKRARFSEVKRVYIHLAKTYENRLERIETKR